MAPMADPPAVTIVRPVCGIEPFIEETLGSSFALDHPEHEILFCVDHADDPVVPLIHRLMEAHPGVTARLLVGEDRIGASATLSKCV